MFNGLVNLFKSFRRRRTSSSVKLCPRCHERSLSFSSWMDGWITPEVYLCHSCGYRGPVYVEMTIEEYKQWKNSEK